MESIVPAQPGWVIRRPYGASNSRDPDPIIAWQIWIDDDSSDDSWVNPITIRGADPDADHNWIQQEHDDDWRLRR